MIEDALANPFDPAALVDQVGQVMLHEIFRLQFEQRLLRLLAQPDDGPALHLQVPVNPACEPRGFYRRQTCGRRSIEHERHVLVRLQKARHDLVVLRLFERLADNECLVLAERDQDQSTGIEN